MKNKNNTYDILLEAYNRKYGTFYFTDLEHLHNTIGKTMCWQIGTVINGLNDNIPINPTKDDVDMVCHFK